jgi:hypothetical protein
MTLLAPLFLVVAGALAAVVVGLHLIVTREPRAAELPTARFAPERRLPARPRATRLRDALLLATRVGILLAVGLALAHPILTPRRRATTRVVLLDRSNAARSAAEGVDSARALLAEGDELITFDSIARRVGTGALDSLASASLVPDESSLSAALVMGLRAAAAMRERTDSVEMVVVSPFATQIIDQATDSIRALWPGAIRLVKVAMRQDDSTAAAVALEGAAEDPLRYALPRIVAVGSESVRIARGALDGDDSTWVRRGPRVLVHWPLDPAAVGAFWTARRPADTVGAVIAGDVVVVAPFARRVRSIDPDGAVRVVARWVDGEPAAVERSLESGCLRTVMLDVPEVGDLVLQPRFQRLLSKLTAPCERRAPARRVSERRIASLAGTGRSDVSSAAIPRPRNVPSPLAPWLLGIAVLLAMTEWLVRRRVVPPRESR